MGKVKEVLYDYAEKSAYDIIEVEQQTNDGRVLSDIEIESRVLNDESIPLSIRKNLVLLETTKELVYSFRSERY